MDKKKAIVCFIVAPLVCILIIGMYGVGFAMTVDKFTYNTNINGYNVSLKSSSMVTQQNSSLMMKHITL